MQNESNKASPSKSRALPSLVKIGEIVIVLGELINLGQQFLTWAGIL